MFWIVCVCVVINLVFVFMLAHYLGVATRRCLLLEGKLESTQEEKTRLIRHYDVRWEVMREEFTRICRTSDVYRDAYEEAKIALREKNGI